MNRKTALTIFLSICVLLAFLLLSGIITPIVSGAAFAIALVVAGGLSDGFRKKKEETPLSPGGDEETA